MAEIPEDIARKAREIVAGFFVPDSIWNTTLSGEIAHALLAERLEATRVERERWERWIQESDIRTPSEQEAVRKELREGRDAE